MSGTLVPKYRLVTVTTAGTPVQILPASISQPNPVVSVWIQAKTNKIIVGDGTASSGIILDSVTNDKIQLTADAKSVIDLGKVYLDTNTSGGTASVVYLTKV